VTHVLCFVCETVVLLCVTLCVSFTSRDARYYALGISQCDVVKQASADWGQWRGLCMFGLRHVCNQKRTTGVGIEK